MDKIEFYSNPQYYCTENYHRVGLGGLLITDGVKHVFDKFQCYWIGDIVASYAKELLRKEQDFCVVKVILHGKGAIFTIDDGNDNVLITQHVRASDLLVNIKFYIQINEIKNQLIWVACLPSEY